MFEAWTILSALIEISVLWIILKLRKQAERQLVSQKGLCYVTLFCHV
jgi:hypothetical protein